jgi:hypothetical protein
MRRACCTSFSLRILQPADRFRANRWRTSEPALGQKSSFIPGSANGCTQSAMDFDLSRAASQRALLVPARR